VFHDIESRRSWHRSKQQARRFVEQHRQGEHAGMMKWRRGSVPLAGKGVSCSIHGRSASSEQAALLHWWGIFHATNERAQLQSTEGLEETWADHWNSSGSPSGDVSGLARRAWSQPGKAWCRGRASTNDMLLPMKRPQAHESISKTTRRKTEGRGTEIQLQLVTVSHSRSNSNHYAVVSL
jgi:hypothetical protein